MNVLEYWETKKDGRKQHFSWVTKPPLTSDNVYKVMRAGCARWKVESETFNTLKNQGYNFQHNYGHGYKNLCSVMALLRNSLIAQVWVCKVGLCYHGGYFNRTQVS